MNSMNSVDNFTNLVLTSNAFYGESKAGDWTLRMIDAASGTTGGLLNWSIRFFGH